MRPYNEFFKVFKVDEKVDRAVDNLVESAFSRKSVTKLLDEATEEGLGDFEEVTVKVTPQIYDSLCDWELRDLTEEQEGLEGFLEGRPWGKNNITKKGLSDG